MLLQIAERCPRSLVARWEFASHPAIQRILESAAFRVARNREEREDIVHEATARIVEVAEGVRFKTEGELVSYWSLRARGLVEAGLRSLGGCVFRDGRVHRKEQAIDVSETSIPAALHLSSEGRRSATDERAELDRMIGVAEGIASARPVMKTKGRGGIERVAFVAQVREQLIEAGERVVVRILGAYVDEYRVACAMIYDGVLEHRATLMCDLEDDIHQLERSLDEFLARGVHQVVTNEGTVTDLGLVLRVACRRRKIELEYFDLDAMVRELDPDFFEALDMDEPQRLAYALAKAKAAENALKQERY